MNGWVNTGLHEYNPQKQEMISAPSWASLCFSGKESSCQRRRHGFDPWSGKIPHAVEQQTEPVCHNYWACAPEPSTREATTMRNFRTARKSSLHSLQLERSLRSSEDPAQPKRNKYLKDKLLLPYSWLQWFSPRGDFLVLLHPPPPFGQVWRHTCLLQLGKFAACIWWVEAKAVAAHPIMHSTASTTKNYLTWNTTSPKAEQPHLPLHIFQGLYLHRWPQVEGSFSNFTGLA